MGEFHPPKEFKLPQLTGGQTAKSLLALQNWRRKVLTQFGWTLWKHYPETIEPESLAVLNKVDARIKELQTEEKAKSKRKKQK